MSLTYLCLKNAQCTLEGEVALSVQESGIGQSDLFLRVVECCYHGPFCLPLPQRLAAAPRLQSKSSSHHFQKLQSIFPTALRGDIAAAIQEITILLFFENGLELRSSVQGKPASAKGEWASGISLCSAGCS